MRRLCIVLRFVFWQQKRRKGLPENRNTVQPVAGYRPPRPGRRLRSRQGVTVFVSRLFPAYVRTTRFQARNVSTIVLVLQNPVWKNSFHICFSANSFTLSVVWYKINLFVPHFFKKPKKHSFFIRNSIEIVIF